MAFISDRKCREKNGKLPKAEHNWLSRDRKKFLFLLQNDFAYPKSFLSFFPAGCHWP
jgi:hypothetical protein